MNPVSSLGRLRLNFGGVHQTGPECPTRWPSLDPEHTSTRAWWHWRPNNVGFGSAGLPVFGQGHLATRQRHLRGDTQYIDHQARNFGRRRRRLLTYKDRNTPPVPGNSPWTTPSVSVWSTRLLRRVAWPASTRRLHPGWHAAFCRGLPLSRDNTRLTNIELSIRAGLRPWHARGCCWRLPLRRTAGHFGIPRPFLKPGHAAPAPAIPEPLSLANHDACRFDGVTYRCFSETNKWHGTRPLLTPTFRPLSTPPPSRASGKKYTNLIDCYRTCAWGGGV